MLSSLKKMDKKFLILVGMILGLPILIIIFLLVVQSCGGKTISYSEYESKMITAAEKYIGKIDNILTAEGELIEVNLSKLVEDGYIKSTEKLLNDSSCDGQVLIRRNGISVESTKGGYVSYIPTLNCSEYSTEKIVDKLKEQLVTQDEGLYLVNDNYVFKGKKIKNYIEFFGTKYVVLEIDENNILKLLKTTPEQNKIPWDNKFNSSVNKYVGKNIYKDSLILEYLMSDYMNSKKFTSKARQFMIAKDVCVGSRNSIDFSLVNDNDCSVILENQFVSLLNVGDFAKASLDSDCTNLNTLSCSNYNYLNQIVSSTWTLNSANDNNYEVFYMIQGLMRAQDANKYENYHMVIYVDGNQSYTSGSGTSADPYIYK